MVLEKYARIRYNENKLKQPTISRLLRKIVKAWANEEEKQEKKSGQSRTSSLQKTHKNMNNQETIHINL